MTDATEADAEQSTKPSQGTVILQGSYWPDQRDQIVYGIRRNYWSGSAHPVTTTLLRVYVFSGSTRGLIIPTRMRTSKATR